MLCRMSFAPLYGKAMDDKKSLITNLSIVAIPKIFFACNASMGKTSDYWFSSLDRPCFIVFGALDIFKNANRINHCQFYASVLIILAGL